MTIVIQKIYLLKALYIDIFGPTGLSVKARLLADELIVGDASNFPRYYERFCRMIPSKRANKCGL